MPAADKAKGKKAAPPDGAPPVPPVEAEAPAAAAPSLKVQITALEQSIAADRARLAGLKATRDFKEYPKAVKDQTFASREAQDAAGPEYAEV